MSRNDRRYAVAVCLFVFLAMGFAGWYENYEPTARPDVERIMQTSAGLPK